MSNTLHVNQIKKGLDEIKRLGHREETFEILNKKIRLRTVHRKEMERATSRCQPLLEIAKEKDDTFAITNWIQAVKVETLAYSIMRINDIDFEGIDFVTTEEIDDETGHYIKVQKHVFVRDLIEDWEDSVVNTIFKKYKDLTDKAEKEASKDVEFNDENEKAKIEELKSEIADLKVKLKEKEVEDQVGDDLNSQGNPSIDRDVLKDTILNPEGHLKKQKRAQKPSYTKKDPKKQEKGHSDVKVDKEKSPQRKQEEYQDQYQDEMPRQRVPQPQREVSPESGYEYVNEDGIPLEGEQLNAARRQDEMLTRREGERKKGQKRQERQPLNEVNAHVKGQELPKASPKAVKTNKQPEDMDIPVDPTLSSQGVEVLNPQNRKKRTKEDSPKYNEKPDANINPNFRPAHQRNKK